MAARYVIRRVLVGVVVAGLGVAGYVVIGDVRGTGRASAGRTAQAQLDERVQQLVSAAAPVQVAIAARNTATGQTFDFGPAQGMIAASVSKLHVLEALLLAHEQSRTDLSDDEDQQATAMIENSDNDAGQALWNSLAPRPEWQRPIARCS